MKQIIPRRTRKEKRILRKKYRDLGLSQKTAKLYASGEWGVPLQIQTMLKKREFSE